MTQVNSTQSDTASVNLSEHRNNIHKEGIKDDLNDSNNNASTGTHPTNDNKPATNPYTPATNVDVNEVAKFTNLAHEWWDKHGAFSTLHQINPLRLNWIEQNVRRYTGAGLKNKKVLDVGCGGGILTESMARRGADATGVDLGVENLKAASLHAKQSGLEDNLRYQHIAVEALAEQQPASYDVVSCMEMLEHVPDPAAIVKACYDLLKPGGVCVLATINRNPKSYLFAIIGAEYILRLLDRGTHDYAKFITPAELDKMAINAGFNRQDLIGLHYNPITKRYWLAQNVDVNYMMAVVKAKPA